MPPLPRPERNETILLPPRKARVAAHTDVLVVGGGPSGLGAALGAADAGAEVILAERYGFMGGNATAALVTIWASHHTQLPRAEQEGSAAFFPTDHGLGRQVIAGAPAKLLRRLAREGHAVGPSPETGFTTSFDPEGFKGVALDLLDEAGVNYLFHALCTDIIGGSSPEGVVFATKSGPLAVRAKVIIDATGDGDLAALAGCRFGVGREEDGLVQPMTLMFRLGQFRRAAFEGYVREHPDQWKGVHGLWDLVEQAERNGQLDLQREDILLFGAVREDELIVNSTRVLEVVGTDVWDLTRAEWEGRRQIRRLVAFFRRYVPGFDQTFVLQSGTQIGVRESRRIQGGYVLTAKDILSARKFPDVVARGTYPLDIHNPRGKGTILKRIPPGEAYEIPLRCLIPMGVENLLVAGRCISGTAEAHSSYRVMPICMATGQAAGACAALAARSGTAPRDIQAVNVQGELRRQGALPELSEFSVESDHQP
jgi:hypothetical protein